jgi:exodeoxyribonuclease VII large subunit
MHRRLDRAAHRLAPLAAAQIARHRSHLRASATQLHALSPLNVLARGYALVYNEDGTLLRSAADASAGQIVHARLASGSIEAQVKSTRTTETSTT